MYIIKNAWLNITKNKGRNVLIGLIVLVISFAATVTLAIKNTASSLIQSYTDAYKVEASISFSRGNMKEKFDFTSKEGMEDMKDMFSNISSLTKDEVISYADSDYVDDFYYTYSVGVNSSDIEAATSDFSFGDDDKGNRGKDKEPEMEMENSTDFTLMGYSSLESMSEFINGSYSMSEIEDDAWELVFDSNACMINSELASLNEISIGDTISVSTDDNTLELTVVGIFDESDSEGGMSMFSNSANTILTNVDVVASLESETYTVTPTYILSSYDDVDGFQEELYEKGLDENYTVTTNLDEVESATSSISNVSSFATTFLVLTFVIGAVVLLVINQINIRERKYEIGVLRTIGMKKSLLTLQFLCELLIVSFMALMLGCALGACASKPVGNSLLKQEIASSEANTEALGERFGGNDKEDNKFDVSQALNKPTVQAYSSINAVVDVKVILELLGICTLLMVIGSLTAILSIQRFSPLEILKERS